MMKHERWLTKIERIFLVKSYLLGRVEVLHCQFVVSENWWFVGPEVSEMNNLLRVCPIPLTTTRTITTPGPPSDDNHSSWYHSNFFGVKFLYFTILVATSFFLNCVFLLLSILIKARRNHWKSRLAKCQIKFEHEKVAASDVLGKLWATECAPQYTLSLRYSVLSGGRECTLLRAAQTG